MKTITLNIELTYDDDLMHSGDDGDIDAKEWFLNRVLNGKLSLFESQEIGDFIGEVKIVDDVDESFKNKCK